MNDAPALNICIGAETGAAPGFLNLGWGADADVPFCPTDGFSWPDRVVHTIVCGKSVTELPVTTFVRLLLECRRVLRPGGSIRFAASVPTELPRFAALAGLEATERALEFTKRDRRVTGDPLVSILIPAYSPRFFAACLDSALAQTYDQVEIVVCDDSPDDAIERIVRDRAARRPIRYVRNPVRLGVRANYRQCFELARGEFIKFLCDDDLLAPTCVAALLDAFREAPDITLATSHRKRIDAFGNRLPEQPATMPIVDADAVIAGCTLANAMLMAGLNVVGEPSTTLFRKADLLDQAPDYFRFNGEAGHGVIDMVTWSALLLKGDAVYVRESLSSFRIHPGQRQHDPAKARRNIESIRGLQSAWLALGLHERIPRDQLLAKPFPPPDGREWQARTVRSLPQPQFVGAEWKFALNVSAGWR